MIPKYLPDYPINKKYKKKVAYFCMEYAINQALKIYAGGLGFLAGSHLRSTYDLGQNFIAIGILWTYGYYDQNRYKDRSLRADFIEKHYSFLEETNISFYVKINNANVLVKAYYLPSNIFKTSPLFLLTTDIPENDYLSRTITQRLYAPHESTRIAQSMVLGIGGGKLLDILNMNIDVYHLNEGHGIPLAFYLYKQNNENIKEVKKKLVFTTHTPEKAGNEEHSYELLNQMDFFYNLSVDKIKMITGNNGTYFNYTLAALKLAKVSNAVSKNHEIVTKKMWSHVSDISVITSVTNAQNQQYWQDSILKYYLDHNDDEGLITRKKQLKKELFDIVADQTGKLFDEDILTIVWARRFASYKRPALLMYDWQRFINMISSTNNPVQVIWAGKPYPEDQENTDTFNHLIYNTRNLKNCAVLTGYELNLSKILKKGSDIWLNTPRYPREASGTSGMTAAMNASVNCSIADGWIPEFIKDEENGFIIPGTVEDTENETDKKDASNLMDVLEKRIIPYWYKNKKYWLTIMKNSMNTISPYFDSNRMADEYYQDIYGAY